MTNQWKAPPRKGGYRADAQRDYDMDQEPQERDDPLATARWARSMRMGKDPSPEYLGAIYCEEAGRAIVSETRNREEAEKLWQLFLDFDKADARYFSLVIGRPRFPNASKLEFMPERLETRPDDRPDLRTDDEKHRDAVNTWMKWQGLLGRLQAYEASSIKRAARQMEELHKGGEATVAGKTFVHAMRMLRDVAEAVDG